MVRPSHIKSICFFSSYYTTSTLPEYIKFYLTELTRHFSEVVFLTNEKSIAIADLEFLHNLNIPFRLYKNEGFDFGMWYKAFREFNISEYDRIGLVNDSCVLFNKLDFFFQWLEKENPDYAGMTDCNKIQYHIQSYFIVINKQAIAPVATYFRTNGIVENIKDVIKIYEVGLSNYLVNLGLKLKAQYSVSSIPFPFKNVNGQFKGILMRYSHWKRYMAFKNMQYMADPTWYDTKDLIQQGMPMIKRKILTRSYGVEKWYYMLKLGFDPFPGHYVRLIEDLYPDADSKRLMESVMVNRGMIKELVFYSYIFMAETYYFCISHKIYIVKRAILLVLHRD